MSTGYEHIWNKYFSDVTSIKGKAHLALWLKAARWSGPGCTEGLIWAEVRTKGSLRYKLWVHLSKRQSGCTCPVRDAACIHRLALVILWHEESLEFEKDAAPPPWAGQVSEVQSIAHTRKKPSGTDPLYPDASRLAEIKQGYRLLETWLVDTTSTGWQTTLHASPGQVEELAARLVNYRLPGPARILRELLSKETDRPALVGHLRHQLAALTLACRVMSAGMDHTDPDTWIHFMQFTGVTLRKDYIQRLNLTIHDIWLVLHTCVTQEDDLSSRKTWLMRMDNGQPGFILDFAWKRQPLSEHWPVGSLLRGNMYFFPGTHNHRLLAGDLERIEMKTYVLPEFPTSWLTLLREWALLIQDNPWLGSYPFIIRNATAKKAGDLVLLVDDTGKGIPCDPQVSDTALRYLEDPSGHDVFGEITMDTCRPMTILHPGHVQAIL